jgi:hypothetical protein
LGRSVEQKDWFFLAVGVAQVLYAALTYHQDRRAVVENNPAKQPRRPLFLIAGFTILTWAAVAFDYFTRPDFPPAQILTYGIDGPQQFHIDVQFRRWEDLKNERAMLITRVAYADKDRMTDEWIAKSTPYTIEGPQLRLVAITHTEMRFASGALNPVEYNLAVLPSSVRPEQIKSLGDVPQLGGKVLATSTQIIPVGQPQPPKP